MNATELRSLEEPVAAVSLEDVPPSLLERAAAYNDAVTAFREVIRGALVHLQEGRPLDGERAASLRTSAVDLVTAREWLLELARLPSSARRGG
jgi:hypothetical protein